MDLMTAKAQRVNRQRILLQRQVKNGEITAEEGSPDWFQQWKAKLLADPKFGQMEESIMREVRSWGSPPLASTFNTIGSEVSDPRKLLASLVVRQDICFCKLLRAIYSLQCTPLPLPHE